MTQLGLHEAIFSLRAMRRLHPDPIPAEDLRYLVEAATQAPSGSNQQHWAFVVVTDAEQRRRIGEIYRELGERFVRPALEGGELAADDQRFYRGALRLAADLGRAPALILACLQGPHPTDPIACSTWYGSIYPAIQNLMLAARSRGLGATLTTLHKAGDERIREIVGVPEHFETVALIPVGRPRGRWGRPLRAPAREVTHWDRWGGQGPG
jgi:nitroreductase